VRRAVIRRADLDDMKPPPVCEACARSMWWHGSTEGWGCPDRHGGSPQCRSRLYRPKPDPKRRWVYPDRYPELAGENDA
jgi:hypothetical protein